MNVAFLGRVGGIVSGLMVLIMAIGGQIIRRDPSTAFWVLGVFQNGDSQRLYLSTPNGGVRREIASSLNASYLYPVGWSSSGNTFFYLRQTGPEVMQLIRFDIAAFEAQHIADHLSSTPGLAAFLSPIPHSGWQTIVLNSVAGAIIYRVSPDGSVMEAVSPAYESVSSIYWTDDGEWFYYVAGNGGNLTNGLYRQRIDGSDFQELMQFRGSAFLTPVVDGSNSFVFTVINYTIEYYQQVYRISPDDRIPVPLTPANQHFALVFHQPHEWVILWQHGTISRNGHLFRVRISGEDLTPLYPLETDLGDIGIAYPIGEEDVIFVGMTNNSPMLYRINVATLEQQTLTPPDYFTQIRNPRLIADGKAVIFEGVVNQDLGLYRVDLEDCAVRKIATLPFTQAQTNLLLVSETIGVITTPIGNGNRTQILRIDLANGGVSRLVEFETHVTNVSLALAPEPLGRLIVTNYGNRSSDSNFQQVWIDPETITIRNVVYGSDWRFSPIIDTDWNAASLIGLGTGLLIIAIGWVGWRTCDSH